MRGGAWKTIFRIDWRWGRKLNFQSHRLLGLLANVFLLVLSVTGIALGFPQTFRAAVETIAGRPAGGMARVQVEQSSVRQPLDVYIRAALRELPGGQVRELRLPRNLKSPVTVRIWHEGDFRPEGSNQVTLNPSTAAILAVDRAAAWSTARRVAMTPTPLHYAEWGGGIVKALWCAAGLAPTFLFISGLAIWWVPFKSRRRTGRVTRLARTKETEGILVA